MLMIELYYRKGSRLNPLKLVNCESAVGDYLGGLGGHLCVMGEKQHLCGVGEVVEHSKAGLRPFVVEMNE